MLTYTYVSKGKFELMEKPKPTLLHERDAIVKVTLASICSSDLHIKHGSVPRAVPGITVGHEMVGVVEAVGARRHPCQAGGPGDGQRGNVLRRVLFLQKGLCQQLHGSKRRLGARLPHRRRAGGICAGALRGSGAEQNSGRRDGSAGAAGGRCAGHRVLGGAHLRHHAGGYRAGDRSGPDGAVHAALRDAASAQAHRGMRKGRKPDSLYPRALSRVC